MKKSKPKKYTCFNCESIIFSWPEIHSETVKDERASINFGPDFSVFFFPLRRSALYLCFPLFLILYPKAFGFFLFSALNVTKRHDYVFTIIYTCKTVIGARLSEMPEILVDAIAFVPHDIAACNNSRPTNKRPRRSGREIPGARELDRRNQPSKFQKLTSLRMLRYNKSGYVGISDKNSFISLPFLPNGYNVCCVRS